MYIVKGNIAFYFKMILFTDKASGHERTNLQAKVGRTFERVNRMQIHSLRDGEAQQRSMWAKGIEIIASLAVDNILSMRAVSAVLLMVLLAGPGCVNDLAEIDAMFDKSDSDVEIGDSIEILYSDSAFVRIRLTSPTLHRYTKRAAPKDEFPEGLHVDFLDRFAEVQSTLDAEKGSRYPRENKIVVSQNVILRNNRGQTLETSELTWDERDQSVSTDRFVKFTKPEEIIYAYGFKANQDFTEYQLYSVVARVKIEDMQKIKD